MRPQTGLPPDEANLGPAKGQDGTGPPLNGCSFMCVTGQATASQNHRLETIAWSQKPEPPVIQPPWISPILARHGFLTGEAVSPCPTPTVKGGEK